MYSLYFTSGAAPQSYSTNFLRLFLLVNTPANKLLNMNIRSTLDRFVHFQSWVKKYFTAKNKIDRFSLTCGQGNHIR